MFSEMGKKITLLRWELKVRYFLTCGALLLIFAISLFLINMYTGGGYVIHPLLLIVGALLFVAVGLSVYMASNRIKTQRKIEVKSSYKRRPPPPEVDDEEEAEFVERIKEKTSSQIKEKVSVEKVESSEGLKELLAGLDEKKAEHRQTLLDPKTTMESLFKTTMYTDLQNELDFAMGRA
jgi:hypothetical protein